MVHARTLSTLIELLDPRFAIYSQTLGLEGVPPQETLAKWWISIVPKETIFFRDEPALQAFKEVVMPSYLPDRTLDVVSIGCSDGKEPYSLLADNWNRRDRLRIDAVDISPELVKAAKAGTYFFQETEDVSRELQSISRIERGNFTVTARFDELFLEEIVQVSISEGMRKHINFRVHDITAASLGKRYDVALLLNVLRHYSEKGKKVIIEHVHKSLKRDGWLLCRNSDSLWPLKPEITEFGFKIADSSTLRGYESNMPFIYRRS